MLFEQRLDFLFGRKSAVAGVLEASPDAGKLFRRRMIFPGAEAGIDLKRKLGELGLGRLGPRFDALQDIFQRFPGHLVSLSHGGLGCQHRDIALQRDKFKIILNDPLKRNFFSTGFPPASAPRLALLSPRKCASFSPSAHPQTKSSSSQRSKQTGAARFKPHRE
ncbi:MAG TPA: hypothetical protein VFQ87_19470 [Bradyrhizobium sp.]|jgi:hypothetical protein|nr:hypothetical protein [Bradyrhizobium sp.]